MRKVTAMAYGAFVLMKIYLSVIQKVTTDERETRMYLFDNLIAIKNKKTGEISISFAGWFSNTTKERLRAFADITTKAGNVFVNGEEVNSFEWILV